MNREQEMLRDVRDELVHWCGWVQGHVPIIEPHPATDDREQTKNDLLRCTEPAEYVRWLFRYMPCYVKLPSARERWRKFSRDARARGHDGADSSRLSNPLFAELLACLRGDA